MTWKDDDGWHTLEGHNNGSSQLLELPAVTMALQHFSHDPLSIVTDSAYVADITQRLDQALLMEVVKSNFAACHPSQKCSILYVACLESYQLAQFYSRR